MHLKANRYYTNSHSFIDLSGTNGYPLAGAVFLALIPICIQEGRPSLLPGTPGGSEEPHPQAGTWAYYEYVEESDAAHPLTWVPGRYTLEGKSV